MDEFEPQGFESFAGCVQVFSDYKENIEERLIDSYEVDFDSFDNDTKNFYQFQELKREQEEQGKKNEKAREVIER